MNEIQKYLAEEHLADFRDGLITRRELLRRVTLITGSAAAATGFLVACGLGPQGSAITPAPPAPVTPPPTGGGTPSPVRPDIAYATPPAQATTDGVTVREDDERIDAGPLTIKGPGGADLIAYQAAPKLRGVQLPGVLVIHENRGLVPHIKDVTRRFATAGFFAAAIDLVSREGGADKLTDQGAYNAALGRRPVGEMVADLSAALDFLRGQPLVNKARIGVTGYCFGGGMTWSVVNSGAAVQAAVPFYGPAPADVSGIGSTRAAVLAVYASDDARVTAGRDAIEPQLKKAGVPYRIEVYPGTGHGFHNDTGARYNPEQARRAWVDTIDWFKRYIG
ncbi:MAG: dienelactone hydrolase family protein [Chloroflexi bacterium]|nr:dienelactone hydrolase family protein [Chloroflexota bacterium]